MQFWWEFALIFKGIMNLREVLSYSFIIFRLSFIINKIKFLIVKTDLQLKECKRC
jgi:hypothetical protein